MARDRKRAQLGLELPPELLERLRAHAAAERRTVTSLLRRWIEAGLAGALEPSAEPSAALVDLANRVDSLERDVAQLQVGALKVKRRSQARPPLLPAEVSEAADEGGIAPAPQALLGLGELEIVGVNHLRAESASPDQLIAAPAAGDAITTAELAERTGTSRPAWNNWAAKAAPGAVRHHPQAGSWRLVGKVAPPGGGLPRWLWELMAD
jgi:hypothetical protein